MTPRAVVLCLVGSLALHAPVGLALARGDLAQVEPSRAHDAWIGGGGDPVELFDEPPVAAEPAPPAVAAADATATTAPAPGPSPATAAPNDAKKPSRRARSHRASQSSAPAPRGTAAAPGDAAAPVGLGDKARGDARDLLRAFTRAIAPANQADAAWSRLDAGRTLEGDVSFDLDADGHVTASEPAPGAPAQLSELLRRTTFLLKGATFAPRAGEAAAGRRRFHVRMRVSDTGAADVEGGTVELSFDVTAGVGHAWFLRARGRRVDVEIRPLRS